MAKVGHQKQLKKGVAKNNHLQRFQAFGQSLKPNFKTRFSSYFVRVNYAHLRFFSKKHHCKHLGGGFQYVLFLPLGEMIQFDYCNIFQMGWFNHQLGKHVSPLVIPLPPGDVKDGVPQWGDLQLQLHEQLLGPKGLTSLAIVDADLS